MTLATQAISAAGLTELTKRRSAGETLSPAELETARGADLLALGAAADAVRIADTGIEVRIHPGAPPASAADMVVIAANGDRGTPLFRRIALARLAAPQGARVVLDFGEVGLEIAQVALSFGVSDLTGPLPSARELPIAGGKKLAKRDELAGYIARAKRSAVFVDSRERST